MDVLKIDGSNISIDTRFVEDLKADSMDQFFLIDGFGDKSFRRGYLMAGGDKLFKILRYAGDDNDWDFLPAFVRFHVPEKLDS